MHFSPPLFGDLFRTGDGYDGTREAEIGRDHHHGTRSLRTHAVHFFPMRNRYYQLRSTEVKLFFVERLLGSNNHLGELRKKMPA